MGIKRLHEIATAKDPRTRVILIGEWASKLKPSEIATLIVAAGGSRDHSERLAAVLVLDRCGEVPSRLRAECLSMVRRLVRRGYPSDSSGLVAFRIWHKLAPPEAERFLATLDLKRLSEDELNHVVKHLSDCDTGGAAFARLKEVERSKTRLARQARMLRELSGDVAPTRIAALLRAWRKSRNKDALVSLYHLHISKMPVLKTKVSDVVKLLGRPDRKRGKSVWYVPSEGAALYVEGDDRGRVVGTRWG